MARPQMRHFTERDLILHFQKCGIKSVINLQVPGEHAHCGEGILSSTGFSYDPEIFMRSNSTFQYFYAIKIVQVDLCNKSETICSILKRKKDCLWYKSIDISNESRTINID